jgi:serine O-acetyltransferase
VTGVEIHPAASIGSDFFIDHGSGVVIGETAEIGDRVTLYQGVTLGGTGFARGKRHPTLEDDVTVGSGAKLLGPVTVGQNAKVGANTVVIEDVPAHTTVVGNPGHPVRVEGRPVEGPDTDWIHLPDPIADAIKGLSDRIADLEKRLADATGEQAGPADVTELRPKKGPSSAGG